ncbi:hypothetical protein NYS50_07170 [Curtobacterium flaccumfaciens pv. flaccumfaciens]|uniref:hypothetical protein n=1 Tax=Curtobacterium flaccumfaciens TaxID=2035 RepID=UPI00217D5326|nr:hypothetical protein [Curtobacterium flaccumfaciens]MCS6547650.1 hypothetical protein [Curtobacterium flaccumfaciens pv. flaccumfaciens]
MADDIESIIRRVVREELERNRGDAAEQATGKRAYTVQSMSEAYEVSFPTSATTSPLGDCDRSTWNVSH